MNTYGATMLESGVLWVGVFVEKGRRARLQELNIGD